MDRTVNPTTFGRFLEELSDARSKVSLKLCINEADYLLHSVYGYI